MSGRFPVQHVPERFLRHIWKHQQFHTLDLRTTDGRPVAVLSPGKSNNDGGPDFTGARIRIGDSAFAGDIELHGRGDDWFTHGHQCDPKYNTVILHVVLNKTSRGRSPLTRSKRRVPVLCLEPYLISPRSAWRTIVRDERAERIGQIPCSSVNADVSPVLISRWIRKLARERLEIKMKRFEERLKERAFRSRKCISEPAASYGDVQFGIAPEDLPVPVEELSNRDLADLSLWNQLMYEGVMDALGYEKNRKPFVKLAAGLNLETLSSLLAGKKPGDRVLLIEAIMFNVSGLLPRNGQGGDRRSRRYVDRLRALRRPIARAYHRGYVTEAEWQFFRLRPENFPTLRLAGMARLLSSGEGFRMFTSASAIIGDRRRPLKERARRLESMFVVSADSYWRSHYLFGVRAKRKVGRLIGKGRADEIIVNAVLPIVLLFAKLFGKRNLRSGALGIFERGLRTPENSVTRKMKRELIRERFRIDSPVLQQGLIQLHGFWCREGRCAECAVGKRVFRKAAAESQA